MTVAPEMFNLSPCGRPVRELLERALPANGTPFDFATYQSRLTAAPTGLGGEGFERYESRHSE
jgi:hypothetical protein